MSFYKKKFRENKSLETEKIDSIGKTTKFRRSFRIAIFGKEQELKNSNSGQTETQNLKFKISI